MMAHARAVQCTLLTTITEILTRNPPENWVILMFSGQKPCTIISEIILHSFYIFQGLKMWLVFCKNTKENFWWEPEKKNDKFHKITSYTWNFQNFTCLFTILVKFDIHFLGLPWQIFVVIYYRRLITSLALKKCKKDCDMA